MHNLSRLSSCLVHLYRWRIARRKTFYRLLPYPLFSHSSFLFLLPACSHHTRVISSARQSKIMLHRIMSTSMPFKEAAVRDNSTTHQKISPCSSYNQSDAWTTIDAKTSFYSFRDAFVFDVCHRNQFFIRNEQLFTFRQQEICSGNIDLSSRQFEPHYSGSPKPVIILHLHARIKV